MPEQMEQLRALVVRLEKGGKIEDARLVASAADTIEQLHRVTDNAKVVEVQPEPGLVSDLVAPVTEEVTE